MDKEGVVHPDAPSTSAPSLLIARRHFLLAGSAAVVGAAATGLPQQVVRVLKGSDATTLPILSVGYWNGSIGTASAEEAKAGIGHNVKAADRLSASGNALAGGATVRVVGLWRAEQHRATPANIGIKAIFPAVDPKSGEKLSFVAWNHSSTEKSAHRSAPSKFFAPVDGRNALELGVEMTHPVRQEAFLTRKVKEMLSISEPAAPVTKSGVCSMTVNRRSSSLQLNRGVYFIALQESEHDAKPDWSSIKMLDPQAPGATDAAGKGLLYRASLTGAEPVPFSYLVISVDQA